MTVKQILTLETVFVSKNKPADFPKAITVLLR